MSHAVRHLTLRCSMGKISKEDKILIKSREKKKRGAKDIEGSSSSTTMDIKWKSFEIIVTIVTA